MSRRGRTNGAMVYAEDAAARETRWVLWIVLWLNLGVAAAKFGYGLLTGSVSMQADGIHSSFDGLSNVIGLIGLWAAAHPPDALHPYGRKKYETFAAAAIGLMLFGTCLYILRNSYLHWSESVVPVVTGISFAVMLGTMAVNWGVMTWERRRGSVLKSEILVADSRHTASDILSSLAVLIGLAAVAAGYPLLDPIAGVVIAGFIGRTGLLVLQEATQSLADQARLDADAIREVALTVEGVRCCDEIRTRGLPRYVFMDLCIHVDSAMTIARAHTLAHNVEDRLKQAFPGVAEVVVHVEPEDHG
ncbi:MAG TPA: cation diffusion facilitator family transporter [Nitrospirales bacterium]|nr:cation diffusion facilitator family transporter [Nitrospirales bacterium]